MYILKSIILALVVLTLISISIEAGALAQACPNGNCPTG